MIVSKNHWFWKAIGFILFNKKFCTTFASTIGPIIAVPDSWIGHLDAHRITIEHEKRHVEQFKFWGLGNAWLGIPAMALIYILPLPIFFAVGRWMIERQAYLVSLQELRSDWIKNKVSVGLANALLRDRAARISDMLTSKDYAWTFPPWRWVKRYMTSWFVKQLER